MKRILFAILLLGPQAAYTQHAKAQKVGGKAATQVNPISPPAKTGDDPSSAIAPENNAKNKQQESWEPPPWASLLANSIAAFGAVGALIAVGLQTRAYRISSERQLRAYIVPERGSIANVANVTPDPPGLEQHARVVNPKIGPVASIAIKNTGQSPSFNVRHTVSIYIRAYTNPPVRLNKIPIEGEPSTMILGPQVVATMDVWLPNPLTPLEVENMKAKLAVIYVVGIIEYTDIFGKSHATHYQMEHHSGQGKIGWNTSLTFSPTGNYGD
jgi:hypothetical protein